MKKNSLIYLVILVLMPMSLVSQGLDTLQLKTIFHEPYLPGIRPSFVTFSVDGKSLIYSGNDSAKSPNKLYSIELNGKNNQPLKDQDRVRHTSSPDGKFAVYIKKGDLWLYDIKTKKSEQFTFTAAFEGSVVWSADSKKIAFSKNGDVYVVFVDKPGFVQLTAKKTDEPNFTPDEWISPEKLIVRQTDMSDYKNVYFPEYVGKMVKPGESKRGIPTVLISVANLNEPGKLNLIKKQKGWLRTTSSSVEKEAFVFTWFDSDMKVRVTELYDAKKDSLRTIFSDSTKGWMSFDYNKTLFSPKGDYLIAESERDGWNHLYKINLESAEISQLTKGEFEIHWFDWISNDELVYVSSEKDPGERAVKRLNTKNGELQWLTSDEAFRDDFQLSLDKKTLIYSKTTWNQPFDLFALDLKSRKEVQLTHSVPERFNAINWQKPDYFRFTGRDGKTKISMTLLKPQQVTPSDRVPVVVFVHGAGSLQNVYKGWSQSYWREYLFHQFLTQKGFAVIEVDYRHSTGYGRKFREDVTGWMGKYETQDIVDGLDYAQKQTGILDLNRVGIYGGSYGGFMALYATSVEPERFHAAAALRAVTNWENYFYANQWYTQPRLGTPEANPENYKRSSPLSYADSLKRPVYILHGLIDNNVGFQDAVQYVERLIQTGNERFDMMMYPSERHSFTDPDAWYDEYRRIYQFFEKELNR